MIKMYGFINFWLPVAAFPCEPVKCVMEGSASHCVELRPMYQNEIGARVVDI